MTVDATLASGRALAESLMVTTCVIRRATGATVTDPETLEETPVMATVYTGVCRVKGARGIPLGGNVPGRVVVDQNAEIHLPVATTAAITTDDVWECVSNPHDPALVGGKVRISGEHAGTYLTARRFPIKATT